MYWCIIYFVSWVQLIIGFRLSMRCRLFVWPRICPRGQLMSSSPHSPNPSSTLVSSMRPPDTRPHQQNRPKPYLRLKETCEPRVLILILVPDSSAMRSRRRSDDEPRRVNALTGLRAFLRTSDSTSHLPTALGYWWDWKLRQIAVITRCRSRPVCTRDFGSGWSPRWVML